MTRCIVQKLLPSVARPAILRHIGLPASSSEFPGSPEAPLIGATTTTAASGGSRESLLGQRPARRKRSAADAGCRNPGAKHLWRDGQAHAGRAKFLYIENSSALLQRAAASEQYPFKLLLISVAGHSFLRYIELSASSRKWPGLPKPLLQGEVARRRRDGEVVQRRACPL